MNIQKIPINQLIPASYNPRKDLKPTNAEYQKIKRSIETFGYVDPLIVNANMTVIGGHQRLKVLKDIGFTDVECVVVDLDQEKEKALNIALNKISGDWNQDLLKELLEDLSQSNIEIELTGFDFDEIENLMNDGKTKEIEEDEFDTDEALKEINKPISKRGDVWQLGRHRLMCGDSTCKEEVETLMSGQKADLFLTDPPYNLDYKGKTDEKLTIKNDKMSEEDFVEFLNKAFQSANQNMKNGAVFYIWQNDNLQFEFRLACKKTDWKIRQCLIWNKNSLVMSSQDYQWKHEACLYGWKDGAGHYWASDRKQTTVLNFDRPTKNKEHPTMKPLELFGYLITNSSRKNEIVLDLFGGSGTTLIASEQFDRTCYTMELDERYCDVIVQRWEKLTGKKATLIATTTET